MLTDWDHLEQPSCMMSWWILTSFSYLVSPLWVGDSIFVFKHNYWVLLYKLRQFIYYKCHWILRCSKHCTLGISFQRDIDSLDSGFLFALHSEIMDANLSQLNLMEKIVSRLVFIQIEWQFYQMMEVPKHSNVLYYSHTILPS